MSATDYDAWKREQGFADFLDYLPQRPANGSALLLIDAFPPRIRWTLASLYAQHTGARWRYQRNFTLNGNPSRWPPEARAIRLDQLHVIEAEQFLLCRAVGPASLRRVQETLRALGVPGLREARS